MSTSIYSAIAPGTTSAAAPAGPTLQRKCASCEAEDKLAAAPIQTKLAISSPGDAYEREADRVADQVMAASEASPRITPLVQRQPMEEEEEELQPKRLDSGGSVQRQVMPEEEEEEEMQAKAATGQPAPAAGLSARLAASSGGGQPLSAPTRSFFEGRFGRDFSHVRVHDSSEAAAMNRDVRARAFTHGSHVYFGAGNYAPDSESGRRLLAHELTHVVQQTSAPTLSGNSRGRRRS